MSTSKESPITPSEVLNDLALEVGHYSAEMQPWMRAALGDVPGRWNAAVAEQAQESIWYDAMRVQLCRQALGYLSSKEVRASMDQKLYGSVRQNLINLGTRHVSTDT